MHGLPVANTPTLDTCREGRIRFVSQSVEDLLGHKPDDMVNVSAWEFVHPDDTPRLLELYESDLSHDRAASVHCLRLRHKEGHYVECETVATIVYNVLITRTTVYTDGPDSGSEHSPIGCRPSIKRLLSYSN